MFQIPVGRERVAHGQVLSEEKGVFMHLVVFDGLRDAADAHDVDQVTSAPAELYAWTDTRPLGKRWRVVDNRPINRDALPPVEFVEMAAPEEFQVVDYDGNVLRPATAEEVENAPFRAMVSTDAVEAWRELRPWEDKHLSLRPWDERNAEREDETARLLRGFRGLDEARRRRIRSRRRRSTTSRLTTRPAPRRPSSGCARLAKFASTSTTATVAPGSSASRRLFASPQSPELERLARELGGEYDGSETELS